MEAFLKVTGRCDFPWSRPAFAANRQDARRLFKRGGQCRERLARAKDSVSFTAAHPEVVGGGPPDGGLRWWRLHLGCLVADEERSLSRVRMPRADNVNGAFR